MSRTISNAAMAAMFGNETNEVFLVIAEITHADMTTVRIVNNTEDIISNGDTYVAFPFEIIFPNEDAKKLSRSTMRLCNVNQEIIAEIFDLDSPAAIDVSVIMASDPDTIEAGPFSYLIRDISFDAILLTAQLAYEDVLNELIPGHTMNPSTFGAVFE